VRKSKDRRGNEGIGGRYAVYDLEYDTAGEGKRCATIDSFRLVAAH
jgi:hypothetical protein